MLRLPGKISDSSYSFIIMGGVHPTISLLVDFVGNYNSMRMHALHRELYILLTAVFAVDIDVSILLEIIYITETQRAYLIYTPPYAY